MERKAIIQELLSRVAEALIVKADIDKAIVELQDLADYIDGSVIVAKSWYQEGSEL